VEGRLVLSLEEKRLVNVVMDVDMDLSWAPVTVAGHAYRCVLRVYVCKLPESRRCTFRIADVAFS